MGTHTDDKRLYLETYGCQMNVADSEVVAAVMHTAGYILTETPEEADAIFLNTCSVRDNAEQKIISRLSQLNALRRKQKPDLILGVLGCMAERVREKLLDDHYVDLVAGPDAYTDLPQLIASAERGEKAINVELSPEQTYKEIIPVKLEGQHISGFISIMRGCNKFCSYCIVPYTRGRERSREVGSILSEFRNMQRLGYREVTLLGQSVNSYSYTDPRSGETTDFPTLLDMLAKEAPNIRIRFTSPHPKDMTDETIEMMARHPNICRHIHFPLQSGSNEVLKRMHRGYTKEWYLDRVRKIREVMPDCAISADIICGFCGETEADFQETLEVMTEARLDSAFMFKYSTRPGTLAAKKMIDDVPETTKLERLQRMIDLQQKLSLESNQKDIGQSFEVLIEGFSKKSRDNYYGRTSQNKVIVFEKKGHHIGEYITVTVDEATSATLIGHSVS